jgi:hypothetical protein
MIAKPVLLITTLCIFHFFRAGLETHLVMVHGHAKDEMTKKRLTDLLTNSSVNEEEAPPDFGDDDNPSSDFFKTE